MSEQDAEDQRSLLSVRSVKPGPDVINKLVHRVRALTLRLLPVEVKIGSIKEPTSNIITPKVISAYAAAAGDFLEALPFALLRARQSFMKDAARNIADWDENQCRAIACEVLARRIVHKMAADRLTSIMSTRFRYRQFDGDASKPSSALEFAIDDNCSIFLSSSESQDVINSLWSGQWVQKYNEQEDIDYVPFDDVRRPGFWGHYDPARLSVPRYQNFFRIIVWLFFLLAYSQAVRQPLARLDPHHQSLDEWEYILYIMALAFSLEDLHKLYKYTRLSTLRIRSWNFWTVTSLITDGLLAAAFVIRIIGIATNDGNGSKHLKSFQVLSCVSPFIWMKLITVFDGVKYIGTMQICVGRMLQESTIFFALLALLAAGFLQAMVALDASDGVTERGGVIINTLIQALLQAPDFEKSSSNTFALILYYFWNFANTVLLLNILVSLFSSAYQDVVDDAEAQYLAFFAEKTVGMIRAPDHYVYPPPFNLIEIIFVAPLEFFLNKKSYAKLNRYIMLVLFCVPLTALALFEARLDTKGTYIHDWFGDTGLGDENTSQAQDPEVEDGSGLEISKVKFKELVKVFPNTNQSMNEIIIREIHTLHGKIEELSAKLQQA